MNEIYKRFQNRPSYVEEKNKILVNKIYRVYIINEYCQMDVLNIGNFSCFYCVNIKYNGNNFSIVGNIHFLFKIVYIIFVFILIINILTIFIILSTKSLINSNGLIMLNLSINDLILGFVIFLPIFIGDCFGSIPDKLCNFQAITFPLCIGMSSITLLYLNFDRYLSIISPFRYEKIMTRKFIIFSLAILWIIRLFLCLLPLFQKKKTFINSVLFLCLHSIRDNKFYWFTAVVFDFILTSFSLVFMYAHLFQISKKLRRVTDINPLQKLSVFRSNWKGLKSLMFIILSYYLSWTPIGITILLTLINTRYFNVASFLPITSFHIFLLNGITNSLIYGSTNKKFKLSIQMKIENAKRYFGCNYKNIDNVRVFSINSSLTN